MIGTLYPANIPVSLVSCFAERFSISQERLAGLLSWMENQENPELLLLQNIKNADAEVGAAVFMSSTNSISYRKSKSPRHTRIWRDFYYQCLFSGMHYLVEVGCTVLRVESPGYPYAWTWDAFTCLFEAHDNIRKNINPNIQLAFREDSVNWRDIAIVRESFNSAQSLDVGKSHENHSNARNLDFLYKQFQFDKHRLIRIRPHVREGMNMRAINIDRSKTRTSYVLPQGLSGISIEQNKLCS